MGYIWLVLGYTALYLFFRALLILDYQLEYRILKWRFGEERIF